MTTDTYVESRADEETYASSAAVVWTLDAVGLGDEHEDEISIALDLLARAGGGHGIRADRLAAFSGRVGVAPQCQARERLDFGEVTSARRTPLARHLVCTAARGNTNRRWPPPLSKG